jgi:hypothetical protein
MERGLTMLLHSLIIAIILYFIMVVIFRQNTKVAENRSLLLGALVLIYMILFGHGMPTSLNKDL